MRLFVLAFAFLFLQFVGGLDNDLHFDNGYIQVGAEKVLTKRKISESKWNPWSAWSVCSKKCGGGKQSRTRTCQSVGGQSCIGLAKEEKPCNVHPCVGKWSDWSAWSKCSKTCGGGDQTRTRTCVSSDSPSEPGTGCIGPSQESQKCNTAPCPKADSGIGGASGSSEGKWGPWGAWSTCSVTCGPGGKQSRKRTCVGGTGCPGPAEETRPCSGSKSCQSGRWGEWGAWSTCSVTCGPGGKQTRKRTCIGGTGCPGPAEETRPCSGSKPCQFGRWGEWGPWSQCSKSCGVGEQTRQRNCIGGPVGGPGCPGLAKEKRSCTNPPCKA